MRQSMRISTQHRVLLVEDDADLRGALARLLRQIGFVVMEAGTGEEALRVASSAHPEVVVSDLQLPDTDALALLPELLAPAGAPSVIILTGLGTIDAAVRAVQLGAENFLTKPVEAVTLAACVRAACVRRRLTLAQTDVPRQEPPRPAVTRAPFTWRSESMQELEERVLRVQSADCPILLLGETGTGKSLLARQIHERSARASHEFVDVNCAGLERDLVESELFGHERGAFTGARGSKAGLFELAEGGTLFFDELGDLDLAVQPKVLKVIEEKRFRRMGDVRERSANVRLLAATHLDLLAEIAEKRFRAELFYRVSTFTLSLPPLRERRIDIIPFAQHLLAGEGASVRLEESAAERLLAHEWPGNLRELHNVLERAVLLSKSGRIEARDIVFDQLPREAPESSARSGVRSRTLDQLERERIAEELAAQGGHVESAARVLGIPRSTLYQKLKAYGIATRVRRSG